VVYKRGSPHTHPQALEKFRQRFDVLAYDHLSELDTVLHHTHADLMYTLKSGKRDGVLSARIPTMVHAVFPTAPWQAHGSSFAFISEWLSRQCSAHEIPTVPHIVTKPLGQGTQPVINLRQKLGIASDALVLGYYGGSDSFDVACARVGMTKVLTQRADVHFIFMNVTPFTADARATFLPGSTDMAEKQSFISACDVMVHARALGESFGLACGEFSVSDKPILTYKYGRHTHHLEVLGDRALVYGNEQEFVQQIQQLSKYKLEQLAREHPGYWDRYTARYNPARVMALFDEHLIAPALQGQKLHRTSAQAHWRYIKNKLTQQV
jgi:hypothetical protein